MIYRLGRKSRVAEDNELPRGSGSWAFEGGGGGGKLLPLKYVR